MLAQLKPWDALLAAKLMAPLRDSSITPNHITTLRLLVGIAGAYLFAVGDRPTLAASLVVLSNFIDHCDGELARIAQQSSRFGHYYDLVCDAAVTVAIFVAIGLGLETVRDMAAGWMGFSAGISIAGIFQLRNIIENTHGHSATAQPQLAGFEAEDVLYLLPLVTVSNQLELFLLAAAIGAPLALLLVAGQYFALRRSMV